jgi:hypothetical protein
LVGRDGGDGGGGGGGGDGGGGSVEEAAAPSPAGEYRSREAGGYWAVWRGDWGGEEKSWPRCESSLGRYIRLPRRSCWRWGCPPVYGLEGLTKLLP